MKKLLIIILLFASVCLLASCNNEQEEHTHSFGYWDVTKEATCTEEGLQVRYCGCNEQETEIIPPKGHTEVVVPGVEATCSESGLTEGKQCSLCGKVLVPQAIAPKISHSYTDKYDESCNACGFIRDAECAHLNVKVLPSKDSTCTETGLTQGSACADCGHIIVEQNTVGLKAHEEVIDIAVEPSCTSAGFTEGKHCSVCNTVIIAQELVDAVGHTEIIDASVAPTCTKNGLTEGIHCAVCNEILVSQASTPKASHTYSDNYDESCNVCGFIRDAECAHLNVTTVPSKEATCTEAGLTEGKICAKCEEVLVEQTILDRLPHTEVYDRGVWATCTENGLTSGIHCGTCNMVFIVQSVIVAKGHVEVTDAAVEPTCTKTGLTEGKHCSVCNEIFVSQSVVEAKGHTLGGWYTTVEATCTKPGEECSNCYYCDFYITQEIVMIEHDYQYEYVESTCTESGYVQYTCACGESFINNYIDPLGHDYSDWSILKEASLTEDGLRTRMCHTCEVVETEIIDKIKPSEGLEFTINSDGKSYSVSGIGTCTDYDIYIPSTYKGLPVTAIGEAAFSKGAFSSYPISNIIIPNSVKTIGNGAFRGCSFNSIEIPDGVESIGGSVFFNCTYLKNISFPDSLTSLGSNAFYWCNSIEYNEYDGGLYIGNENNPYVVFVRVVDTNITDFEMHPDTKIIGDHAFSQLAGYNDYYPCTSLISLTIPNGVKSIGNSAFYGCISLKSIDIPNSVLNIGSGAFQDCRSLTIIDIPNSVTSIGGVSTFKGCFAIKNISIPCEVTEVEHSMFANCVSLESVSGLDSATCIDTMAFYNCQALKSLDLNDEIISIGEKAFYNCQKLENIPISNEITTVGHAAFENCKSLDYSTYGNLLYLGNKTNPYIVLVSPIHKSVTSCEIHPNTEVISVGAFMNYSKLQKVSIPHGITSIGNSLFSYCYNLSDVVIPDSVTTIGSYAFHSCGFESIVIPSSVTSIGDSAFEGCGLLKTVINQSNLNLNFGDTGNGHLAYYASIIEEADGTCRFNDNNSEYSLVLTEDDFLFELRGDVYNLIAYTGDQETITLPRNINGQRYNIHSFSGGKNVIIPEEWECSIGYMSFAYSSELESITILADLSYIDNNAFEGCSSLKTISLPENIQSIGDFAFLGCISLESIELAEDNQYYTLIDGNLYTKDEKTIVRYVAGKNDTTFAIPYGVTNIGPAAFESCSKLKNIYIPNTVENIGAGVFNSCSSLEKIEIPSGVKEISASAFSNCSSLKEVILPAGLTSIEVSAFKNCTSLESISISDSVTYLGGYAFENCYSLKEVKIGNGIDEIELNAFDNCLSLEKVILGEGVSSISSCFGGCISLESVTVYSNLTTVYPGTFSMCYLLQNFTFYGTKSQWEAIYRDSVWIESDIHYYIHCTDGTLYENSIGQ